MKIRINSCMECFKSDRAPPDEFYWADLENSGLYKVTCSKGHQTMVRLQNNKYELLFEFGCMALLTECFGEAIFNIASSVERFHEYCIKIFLKNKEVFKEFDKIWPLVKNQSERQLGAFCFLYLAEFKEIPPEFILNTEKVKIRNDIIHKGYIPKLQETKVYAEEAFNYIKTIKLKLQDKFGDSMKKIENLILIEQAKELKNQASVSTMSVPTVLRSLNNDSNFAESMQNLGKYKTWLYNNTT